MGKAGQDKKWNRYSRSDGGPRWCNGPRLIRPPAANNILIWRPFAVVPTSLSLSFARSLAHSLTHSPPISLFLTVCSMRSRRSSVRASRSLAWPPARASIGEEIAYLPPPTHTYAAPLRGSSLLVTTRFVTHIYACFMGRPARQWRAPLISRAGLSKIKIPLTFITFVRALIISLNISLLAK